MDNELINNEGNITNVAPMGIKSQWAAIGIGFATGAAIGIGAYFAITAISKAVKARKAAKLEAKPVVDKTEPSKEA